LAVKSVPTLPYYITSCIEPRVRYLVSMIFLTLGVQIFTLCQLPPEGRQIIFSMVNVSKIHPPQKQVLKDIYISFYYGAKIGVLGLNGSGKIYPTAHYGGYG
jgi:hypothetical protein